MSTSRYDDGRWHAETLGHFVGLLIDAGLDPAVLFRVVEDSPSDGDGAFVRRMEVVLLPNGHVAEQLKAHGVEFVHKDLGALLRDGVIR